MGRPLHKKYFGNRNLGSSSTTADDGLGGNRVASVTITNQGSYTVRPTVTFSAPDLTGVGAVTAIGTTNMEGNTVAVTAGQGGLNYVVGDLLTITGAGGAIAYVATVDGVTGAVTGVNFTGTGAARGDQTVLTGITSAVATTGGSGDGNAQVDVTYRVKSISISEPGSGYTDAADAAVTFSAGVAAGTSVLETYSIGGLIGNNENAITIYAFVTGGSRKIGDIVKQVGSRRFLVETADGTEKCLLVTDGNADAAGEMDITATDSSGKTYYVKKITAHRATLVRYGAAGHEFATDASVRWTFDSPTLDTTVQIANT